MRRQTAAIVTTVVLLLGLVVAAWWLPVPYVAMSPGPAVDTLSKVDGDKPVIEIKGEKTYPTKGKLDLTTVAVTSTDQKLDLVSALSGWLDPSTAVVPREYVYPGDLTPEQVENQNVEQMQGSQHDAVAAALRQVGRTVPSAVQVAAVIKDTPAEGKLRAEDIIRSVDGTKVDGAEQVTKLVGKRKAGDRVRFGIERDDKPKTVELKTMADTENSGRPLAGIQVTNGYDLPVDVAVNLGQDIGGPSAGTMFALAIVDRLTPGSLAGGRHVAGTGTIDGDGKVGEIGGIQQKIAGAKEQGATVFLVPAGDCPGAEGSRHDGVQLVKISTLDDAVTALSNIAKGSGSVPTCGK